jgi:hypothetical protein
MLLRFTFFASLTDREMLDLLPSGHEAILELNLHCAIRIVRKNLVALLQEARICRAVSTRLFELADIVMASEAMASKDTSSCFWDEEQEARQ